MSPSWRAGGRHRCRRSVIVRRRGSDRIESNRTGRNLSWLRRNTYKTQAKISPFRKVRLSVGLHPPSQAIPRRGNVRRGRVSFRRSKHGRARHSHSAPLPNVSLPEGVRRQLQRQRAGLGPLQHLRGRLPYSELRCAMGTRGGLHQPTAPSTQHPAHGAQEIAPSSLVCPQSRFSSPWRYLQMIAILTNDTDGPTVSIQYNIGFLLSLGATTVRRTWTSPWADGGSLPFPPDDSRHKGVADFAARATNDSRVGASVVRRRRPAQAAPWWARSSTDGRTIASAGLPFIAQVQHKATQRLCLVHTRTRSAASSLHLAPSAG